MQCRMQSSSKDAERPNDETDTALNKRAKKGPAFDSLFFEAGFV